MKKICILMVLALVLSLAVAAQVVHGIQISWTASTTAGVSYNVYGSLLSNGPYTKLTPTPIVALTFLDKTATDGKAHFYVVTSVLSGAESVNSMQASGTALLIPNPPTGLTVTPQ